MKRALPELLDCPETIGNRLEGSWSGLLEREGKKASGPKNQIRPGSPPLSQFEHHNKYLLKFFRGFLDPLGSSKEGVGMTSLTDKIDKLFAEWDKSDSPGCALGIIKDGQLVYSRGYGMANLEHDIPVSSKMVFRIGSTSKQVTTMCIALLAEKGKISLDDDVRKYVPELPEYKSPITIKQLVWHTSGLPDYLDLIRLTSGGAPSPQAYNRATNNITEEDVIEMLARQKTLNFNSGEVHLYSNSGYLLLAVLVKRVSGKSLREFAEEHIFVPLGMKNTHFHDDFTMIVKNRAMGYSPKEDDGFFIDMTTCDIVGDGGIFTTVEDLLLWDHNFYHSKVGSPELIKRMLTPGTLNNGEKCSHGRMPERYYAFGLVVGEYRGLPVVSHGGGFVGFRAEIVRFPEQHCSIICLANLSTIQPWDLALQVADIYLTDQFPEEKPPEAEAEFISLSEEQLQDKVQVYRNPETRTICELSLKDGKLMADAFGFNFQLAPVSCTQFRAVDAPVNVRIEFETPENKPLLMHVSVPNQMVQTFEALKPVELTSDQQAEYVGDYYSDELQVTYKVALEEKKLFFRHKNAPEKPLTPTFKDEFSVASLNIQFIRDKQNQVVAFIMNSERVKNKRFVKQA